MIPDNETFLEVCERDQERYERIKNKQEIEEIKPEELPFYDDEFRPHKKIRRNTYVDTL